MSATIAFDSARYDQVISLLGTALQDLADGAKGPLPLTDDVQLQPIGQTWQPAVDLVAAGTGFFGLVSQHNGDAVGALTGLQAGLAQGRSIFNDTEDLTTVTAEQFDQVLGHPLGTAPSRHAGPGQS